ncbi:MAG TPA: cobyrinic acid a,c-diamide synthase [Clostridiales bacterium]|jgi:CO dehydrogenase maturation factor|nr:cobyrinic acid a,c-diamide synthase [Clostridiales bacterium]HBR09213.1 cobyrinic acid a,c-diamide synthase [Clostridiales bacterium]
MAGKSTVIAVSGKGGVGKTTLSACIVRHLTERRPGARILAIDADPAIGLSVALGVNADRTLDDIRKTIVHNVEAGQTKEAIEMLGEARFRIFDAITEKDGFAFLAIGRPESAGCYCKVNAYLKEVISLLAEDFDYVVIDGEAGIEQINRRVMEKVTHLLLVTDQSRKGVQVLQTIKKVADEMVMYDRIGAVVNRVSNPEYEKLIEIPGVEILAFIENDGDHASNDIQGRSVFALPEDSRVFAGALAALRKMDIL